MSEENIYPVPDTYEPEFGDTSADYWNAAYIEGPLQYRWKDKPHQVLGDAAKRMKYLEDELARVQAENEQLKAERLSQGQLDLLAHIEGFVRELFETCGAEDDYCVQHVGGNVVFGGTNRVIWNGRKYYLDRSYCTPEFIKRWDEQL